jgi:hypothetical protein
MRDLPAPVPLILLNFVATLFERQKAPGNFLLKDQIFPVHTGQPEGGTPDE